ncbi:potassium-transporting ATPase subunit F [Coleofasciculus sp. H7-2]|uniref:potassium-transporting ATPase subunit F n=1 Tax=Coleofasciculus sp. H7-2 TaxID=3351545 RepID=UPI00366CC793
MNRFNLSEIFSGEMAQSIDLLKAQWRKQPLLRQLFILLCLNLLITPAVQAATGGTLSSGQTFWLMALGLVTITLSIYLFVVIFQPERF